MGLNDAMYWTDCLYWQLSWWESFPMPTRAHMQPIMKGSFLTTLDFNASM